MVHVAIMPAFRSLGPDGTCMLKLFVINLDSSTERLNKVSRRLQGLGIPFERFAAVDGRKQKHPLFDRYDDALRRRYRRKPLAGGELGCFASHFLLWQQCVALQAPIVVMEDDVYVTSQFPQALEVAEEHIEKLEYLRLAGTSLHRRPYKKVGHLGDFDLVDHVRGPSGTLCYVLHPKAAQRLIDHAERWFIAVDDYMDRYWRHGVDCWSLMPFTVLVADNGSDIVRHGKEKTPLWLKLVQELMGRVERLRRFVYRLPANKSFSKVTKQ